MLVEDTSENTFETNFNFRINIFVSLIIGIYFKLYGCSIVHRYIEISLTDYLSKSVIISNKWKKTKSKIKICVLKKKIIR